MPIDAQLPSWLVKRTMFDDHSVTRDATVGMNLGRQIREEERMARAQRLNEEIRQMAIAEKERIAEGTVEVTRVLSEMGKTGDYTNPALQSKFWAAVERNPKFAGSPAFKDILDTFQYAEQAKARSALEQERQAAITQRNADSIESRFGLLSQKIDGMAQMEGIKQENREALAGFKNELQMLRDSLKPTRTGQLVHDLPETDLVAMRAELGALDKMYERGKLKGQSAGLLGRGTKITPEQEYETRRQEILKKYDAKRIGAPKQEAAAAVPPVPERTVGTIYQTPKGPYRWNGTGWEAP